MLRTEDLTKYYDGGDVHALEAVDSSFEPGQFAAIIGPSGSGKSTFLNLVGTLDAPTRGRVWIDGEDVAEHARLYELRRRKIGFVFQFHNLVPNLTLLENVQVPLMPEAISRRERRRRAAALLDSVGLSPRAEHRANRVSGGERQRAAIARALVHSPPIVLADEPTGNLDSQNGEQIIELLENVRREHGTLVLIVTHDLEIAGRADRVLRFKDGRVVSEVVPPAP